MEIYRSEKHTAQGQEITSISCRFLENGTLRIEGQDVGPSIEHILGDADYEYWLEIPPQSVERTMLYLLKEAFNKSEQLTFERVRDICKANDIEHRLGHWR